MGVHNIRHKCWNGAKADIGSADIFLTQLELPLAPTVRGIELAHAAGVPIGAPGDASAPGASAANVLRARMTFELLRRLGYVDMSRVALHGHSMGAYVDAALAGAYPTDFRVASQTGGGVRPREIFAGPAPSIAQTETIRVPFQLHHGELDTTVPLSYDQRFDSLLTATSVEHALYTYPNEDHLQVRLDPAMLDRVHSWYAAHGMF